MHGTIIPPSISATNLQGGVFPNQWDEAIEEMIYFWHKYNELLEKALWKYIIHDIKYPIILSALNIMDMPDNIYEVKE